MLVRIVKLTFKPENSASFEAMFNEVKKTIRGFEGCLRLELHQTIDRPNIYFTYSYWKDEAALENYRNSNFFKTTWARTKTLFGSKPEAWSVITKQTLD